MPDMQWRDCQEWRSFGLPLSTTNNEVAKLYDATVAQMVNWKNFDSVGGLEGSIRGMLNGDPNFVMGHVTANSLNYQKIEGAPTTSMDFLCDLADRSDLTEREKLHVEALKTRNTGDVPGAAQVWEDILLEYPLDMLALHSVFYTYINLGYQRQLRDTVARVMPYWKPHMPLYSKLFGLHGFGLMENNMFDKAEIQTRKGLELDPGDAWTTHALAHVLDHTGRRDEGIDFMSSTVKEWSTGRMLSCHNFWHWALFHIDKGQYEDALNIYDAEVGSCMNSSGNLFDITNAASLLRRFEFEGVSVGDRWRDVYETSRPHIEEHSSAFNDLHLLMACLGAKEKDTTKTFMESLKSFVSSGNGFPQQLGKDVGVPMCEAFVAYDDGDFAKATDLLLPVKYDIVKVGGSNAQRDVFHQWLIHAALQSPRKQHQTMAKNLLLERKAFTENSPLTDRLMARVMAAHDGGGHN